jgi:hypothetical protein
MIEGGGLAEDTALFTPAGFSTSEVIARYPLPSWRP